MRIKYISFIVMISFLFVGCKKFLDRPPLSVVNDEAAWVSEDNVRLYVNKYYSSYFPGYSTAFNTSGAAMMGYQFSDDVFLRGNQSNFGLSVPNSSIWSYSLVRSINILIDRLQTRMTTVLEPEAFSHWMGVARFFRAMEFQSLVNRYGDVPYYDHVVSDINMDDLYKPRTPRDEVMDAVYDDLKFAMENVRPNDGDQQVNLYVVAAFASRIGLFEGSWQKYYYHNDSRAQKFFQLAIDAADVVMQSGRYEINSDFRTLFTSENLAGNKEVILFRHYDAAVDVTHSVASYNNLNESVAFGPTTDLIKSFIAVDGKPWQNSAEVDASDFTLSKMVKTRDSRFEASFYDKPLIINRASYWYINKFFPRSAVKEVEEKGVVPDEFTSNKNTTDYPVMRYAEVLLNWIESKAELATIGGATVSQDDLNKSVNAIRNRPLAPEAEAKGVQQTAHLEIASIPNDPERDLDVTPLLWELRRERRMEFAFEYGRYEDLRRWGKLDHMDTDQNPDLLSGGWVNFNAEVPTDLTSARINQISVVKMDGSIIVFDGVNNALINGFYRDGTTNGRQPFLDLPNVNPYLSPVGKTQMDDYTAKGYTLQQTEGWPQN